MRQIIALLCGDLGGLRQKKVVHRRTITQSENAALLLADHATFAIGEQLALALVLGHVQFGDEREGLDPGAPDQRGEGEGFA